MQIEQPLGHGRQRLGRDADRQAGLLVDEAVDAPQQGPAAAKHQPVVDQVGGQIGTAMVERGLDGFEDFLQGIGQRLADLLAGDRGLARQAADGVDAAQLDRPLLFQRIGAADVDLQPLGGGQPDAEAVVAAQIIDDGLVHPVAAGADRLGGHGVGQAHHGHFGGAAADVADHAGHRLGNGQARRRWRRPWPRA